MKKVGVFMRPYCIEFLERMKEKFTIVIFTASNKNYADAILDEIDPFNEIFSFRFYREDCVNHDGKIILFLNNIRNICKKFENNAKCQNS